jgi:hypothetical protein
VIEFITIGIFLTVILGILTNTIQKYLPSNRRFDFIIVGICIFIIILILFIKHIERSSNNNSRSDNIRHLHCIYKSNYHCIFYDSTLSISDKRKMLSVKMDFLNISDKPISSFELTARACPFFLDKSITKKNDIWLFTKHYSLVFPKDTIHIENITTCFDSNFVNMLLINNKSIKLNFPHSINMIINPLISTKRPSILDSFKDEDLNKLNSINMKDFFIDLHEEPFGGYLGVKLSLSIKYNINDDQYLCLYTCGLYYPIKLTPYNTINSNVTFLYDYLWLSSNAILKSKSGKLNIINVKDDIEEINENNNYKCPDVKAMEVTPLNFEPGDQLNLSIWMPEKYGKDIFNGTVKAFNKNNK